jgi:hypothetical protein
VIRVLKLQDGEQVKILVDGKLDHPECTAVGYEDKVNVDCKWRENDK